MKVIIQEKESLLVSCVAGVTKTSLLQAFLLADFVLLPMVKWLPAACNKTIPYFGTRVRKFDQFCIELFDSSFVEIFLIDEAILHFFSFSPLCAFNHPGVT